MASGSDKAPEVFYPVMNDHGDVMALLDATGSNIVARYAYDPWGNVLAATGPATDICPFRWQTKYFDNETGLYYFGYRFFDSLTGRWLSRDPLAENGGVNLYTFCGNDPVNGVDGLGLVGESLWYDRLGIWAGNKVDIAKDYYANNLPWVISGILNTAIDIVSGPAHIPSAIGHLGEGTGCFSADPNWRNAGGVVSDVFVVGSVLAVTASALPSLSGSVVVASPAEKNLTVIAQDGTTITGFTKHGLNRAVGDGAKRAGVKPDALLDALKNPRKVTTGIDVQGRPYSVFTGQDARVVVNPQTGQVVSVNPLSRIGAN